MGKTYRSLIKWLGWQSEPSLPDIVIKQDKRVSNRRFVVRQVWRRNLKNRVVEDSERIQIWRPGKGCNKRIDETEAHIIATE